MLVLTRREGESIVVGHGLVTVTVKRISGGRVAIAVDAPKELTINRHEVERRVMEEDKDA